MSKRAEAGSRPPSAPEDMLPLPRRTVTPIAAGESSPDETLFPDAFPTGNYPAATAVLPAQDPLREKTRPLLKHCQRCMILEARLPRILKGTEKPTSAAEQIELAQLCSLKKLYAAAALFYAVAFAAEPSAAPAARPIRI